VLLLLLLLKPQQLQHLLLQQQLQLLGWLEHLLLVLLDCWPAQQ
jgi:hypothetical protein